MRIFTYVAWTNVPSLLLGLILLFPHAVMGQFNYDFDHPDTPAFQGDTQDFIIEDGYYQLQGSGTPSIIEHTVTSWTDPFWSGQVTLEFSPSNSNKWTCTLFEKNTDIIRLEIGATGPDTLFLIQENDSLRQKTALAYDFTTDVDFEFTILEKALHFEAHIFTEQKDSTVTIPKLITPTPPFLWKMSCHYTSTRSEKFKFDHLAVGQKKVDTIPPQLVDFFLPDSHLTFLSFSENILLDKIRSSSSITPQLDFSKISYGQDSSEIIIEVQPAFSSGVEYQIELESEDTRGNISWQSFVVTHFSYTLAQPGDLIITEILADPSPAVHLPECEYLELYNRSSSYLRGSDYTLADDRKQIFLPDSTIPPNSYVLLVDDKNAAHFMHLSNLIIVEDLPTINNDQDQLRLLDFVGRSIYEVNYTRDWHQNDQRKEGGWSVEMIDPNQPCLRSASNWTSALLEKGGSPGLQNTILHNGPLSSTNFISQRWSNDHTLELQLNKALSSAFVHIEPSLPIDEVDFDLAHASMSISFADTPKPGQAYHLVLNQLQDCTGQDLADQLEIDVYVPRKAEWGELTINEVLFNPRSGGADFIEIKNQSDAHLLLQDFCLEFRSDDTLWTCFDAPPDLPPHGHIALSPDTSVLKEHYQCGFLHPLANVSLPDEGGLVLLHHRTWTQATLFDSVEILADDHSPVLLSSEGISLENQLCVPYSNLWHSSSEAKNGASPGRENSQKLPLATEEGGNLNLFTKSFSPNGDGENDLLVIDIHPPDVGFNARIDIFDMNGRYVHRLLDDQLIGTHERVVWDGRNVQGDLAAQNIYLLLLQLAHPDGTLLRIKKTCVLN